MTEIFTDIDQNVKDMAEGAWVLVRSRKDPLEAAKLLNTVVEYAERALTEEEVEFLQFYFNMKLEMMKNE